MLMMVQGHTVYCLLTSGIVDSDIWYWHLWTAIRGYTAPIFLMVSGAVHIFANKRDENGIVPNATTKRRIKTCLMLFAVGYLLQFPANNLFDLPFLNYETLASFLKVNVLQLFAVTLIFLNILFKLTNSNKQLATICFIVGNALILASQFSLQVDWYKHLPIPFAAFFSMSKGTIFPIMPFSGYLLIGSAMGYLIQRVQPEKRNAYIVKNLFLIGLPYIVIGHLFGSLYGTYGHNVLGSPSIQLGLSIGRVGVAMWVISFSTLVCNALSSWENIISMLSKRSLLIYVIHLLIIYGSPITPGLRHFFFNVNAATAFYCAFFVIFFSILIVYLYDTSNKNIAANYFYKYVIVALLIYMLLI
jgi:hypothetical protein